MVDRVQVDVDPVEAQVGLARQRELRPGTRSVDLKTVKLPPGNYTIYVQMVGKPLFQNRLSNPAIWNHR